MQHISFAGTRLSYRIAPALLWLFLVLDLGFGIAHSVVREEWGQVVLFLALLAAMTGACYAITRVYDVYLHGTTFILYRPFERLELPIEQVTGFETPARSMQLFPKVWLHWRDKAGVRHIARFVVSPDQLIELTRFLSQAGKHVPLASGR